MKRTALLAGILAVLLPGMAMADGPLQSDPQLAAAKAAMDAGDAAQALNLFMQAGAGGKAEGYAQAALIYMEGGVGVPQNYAAAMEWAQKAADAGAGRGNLILGQLWMKGLGVPADTDKALDCFLRADAQGDMKAGRYVGLIAQAKGDAVLAADWFRKAADKGDITSQFLLGQAYQTGSGVPQDYALAMEWYRKSAERGDIIASDGMVGEAGLFEHGLGVPQDMAKAIALYRKAADLGNAAGAEALLRLGQ